MNDSLEKNIQAQIEKLESISEKLQEQVNVERELEQLSTEFVSPDFDLENRFIANMEAFKRFYPEIYQGFSQYQLNRFELKFDTELGVNIFDTKEQNNLYADDVFKSSFFQYQRFKQDPQCLKNTFDEKELHDDSFIHTRYLTRLSQCYLGSTSKKSNDKLPTTISSMMVFGVGAGYHIETLVAEHSVKNLFIYEPHLDLFYLSLYLTDWSTILTQLDQDQAQLHLSLGQVESESQLIEEIADVFAKIGRFHAAHTYLYVHNRDRHMDKVLDEVTKRFHENMLGFGFYDDALMSIGHFYHNMKRGVPILKSGPLPVLQNTPVYIIGNGPSLDNDIEVIRALQPEAIIISCGSAIGALYKYNIVPDFHCEMERCLITKTVLDAIDDPEYLKSITLLALNTVHPDVFPLFGKSIQALKTGEAGSTMYLQNDIADKAQLAYLNYCNPTVANCALSFVENMGFKDITLFGVDMGYIGSQHHSIKSIYYGAESGDDRQLYSANDSEKQVKGNFAEFVTTDFIYDYSRKVIEEFLKKKPHLNVLNCSNGALIRGSTPIQSSSLTSQKSIAKEQIIGQIFTDLVKPVNVGDTEYFEENINQEKFADLCDLICKVLTEKPDSKTTAIETLEAQLENLESFAQTNLSHFYDLLRGSLLHTHSVLLNILNSDQNEEKCLARFLTGANIVKEYILEMKKEYLACPFKVDQVDNSHIWIE